MKPIITTLREALAQNSDELQPLYGETLSVKRSVLKDEAQGLNPRSYLYPQYSTIIKQLCGSTIPNTTINFLGFLCKHRDDAQTYGVLLRELQVLHPDQSITVERLDEILRGKYPTKGLLSKLAQRLSK